MIRLKRARDAASLHKDFTGAGLEATLTRLLEARLTHGDAIPWKGALNSWKKMKPFLQRDSHNKCAYCESDLAHVAHGDVEHFRPKKTYWWLAFCTDNYVFACQICNQTHKSDHFPVAGVQLKAPPLRRALPATAAARRTLFAACGPDPATATDKTVRALWHGEDADLPHPYLDDPEPLFAWRVSEVNQEVHLVEPPRAKARARRAVKAAIDHLGLNRETLVRRRYKIYLILLDALLRQSDNPSPANPAAAILTRYCADNSEYAGMCRYFVQAARRAGSIP